MKLKRFDPEYQDVYDKRLQAFSEKVKEEANIVLISMKYEKDRQLPIGLGGSWHKEAGHVIRKMRNRGGPSDWDVDLGFQGFPGWTC
jgi:hypothetical protein